jgi:hypothetical protein
MVEWINEIINNNQPLNIVGGLTFKTGCKMAIVFKKTSKGYEYRTSYKKHITSEWKLDIYKSSDLKGWIVYFYKYGEFFKKQPLNKLTAVKEFIKNNI